MNGTALIPPTPSPECCSYGDRMERLIRLLLKLTDLRHGAIARSCWIDWISLSLILRLSRLR
jgi:hypothetical protein